jgi:hypothetical protein
MFIATQLRGSALRRRAMFIATRARRLPSGGPLGLEVGLVSYDEHMALLRRAEPRNCDAINMALLRRARPRNCDVINMDLLMEG